MKFKSILKEQQERVEKAVELKRRLNNGNYYTTDIPIYRGMYTKVEYFIERGVREREPKSTSRGTHEFISVLTDTLYPNHPNRNKASFGSLSKAFANSYGSQLNILIPEESAKVRFYPGDTWPKYTQHIQDRLISAKSEFKSFEPGDTSERFRKILRKFKEEFENDRIVDLIRGTYQVSAYRNSSVLEEVLPKYSSLTEIVGDFNSFLRRDLKSIRHVNRGIITGIKQARDAYKEVAGYFSDASKTPIENEGKQQEVIVEGDHLIINPDWFYNFFEWNNGNISAYDFE